MPSYPFRNKLTMGPSKASFVEALRPFNLFIFAFKKNLQLETIRLKVCQILNIHSWIQVVLPLTLDPSI